MRRIVSMMILTGLLVIAASLGALQGAGAQDQPTTTEEPGQPTPIPPSTNPGTGATPTEPASPFGNALTMLVNARNDLELLATSELGHDRPPGWSGSLDINDPQLPLLIRLDLELLAGTLLGADKRPPGWFGVVGSSTEAIARDIRHDLELLADAVLTPDFRPPGWTAVDPLVRCSRSTQALVQLLELGGMFTSSVDPSAPDYCAQIEVEASRFTEINLLNNPAVTSGNLFGVNPFATPATWTVQSDFAVGFLDRSAALQVGTVPNGTPITPLGRSVAQFSKMMLVQGDNFTVFIDYRDTNVTQDEFEALPDADSLGVEPFCAARWCGAG